ncbi:EcsC family protein [Metabacillus litoralis]|uniref:EcsC family protein n=1 Tax=Metabacillus litoralis TaxID=152268 RepID=UPI001BA099FE|nr:EcsC family protein [Metabacillus litoralis]MCM3161974.1 EcsC family protein [Metabacillus litoralis]MCM3411306.1 EcsC family protein [Metabacillus litoralis]UHA60373.1 EcsC family protein [Metabacillus litoralis]
MSYELRAAEEARMWKQKLLRKASFWERSSKKAQNKMNGLIPEKVHHTVTESIKKMIEATLLGSNITTFPKNVEDLTFEQRENLVRKSIGMYKKTAAIEGASTGAGGLLLGLADFPLFLSIKMKFLFEVANHYGYSTKEYEERLFLLYVFQLAFSSETHKEETLTIIENWETKKLEIKDLDWRIFQQEYRDYIDLVKLMQIIPGIGAVVGGVANYHLVQQLGECAMNSYRLRVF